TTTSPGAKWNPALHLAITRRFGSRYKGAGCGRKGDPAKVRLARELRSQTTRPLGWIAQRLGIPPLPVVAWLARVGFTLSKVIKLLSGLNLLSTGGSPLRVSLAVRNPLLGKGDQTLVKVWLVGSSLKGAADSNTANRM